MQNNLKPQVIAIVGPTGVGKTSLALNLAQYWDVEVVNADSRQAYRTLDIGTAKPTLQDRAGVPHHLIDVVDPASVYSLPTFLAQAHRAIADIISRVRVPLVVGGTGQYIWGLLEEWEVPKVPPDEDLRKRLMEQTPEGLFEKLQKVDPEGARYIDRFNVRRIIRALEVYEHTGQAFYSLRTKGEPRYETCVLGLTIERKELYRRLDDRTDTLMENGWLNEVSKLLEKGYSFETPAMSSTGYADLAHYLKGNISWDETINRVKTANHRLARRQYNWFRLADQRIHWIDASDDPVTEARLIMKGFLHQGFGRGKIPHG